MLAIVLILICSLLAFYNFYWKRRGLPPGPTPLPILGNVIDILKVKPGYDAFINWSKQYGPVYTYWLSEKPIVAVTDFESIHEAFVREGDATSGRDFFTDYAKAMRGSINGAVLTEGDVWRVNRRFVLQTLREFGMGKNLMESKVLLEVQSFIDRVRKDLNRGVEEHNFVDHAELGIASVNNQFLFGYSFSGAAEDEFRKLKHILDSAWELACQPLSFAVQAFPAVRHLPPFSQRFHRLKTLFASIRHSLQRQIDDYRERFEANNEAESEEALPFVGCYLREKKRHEQKEKSDEYVGDLFREDALMHFCMDLWIAGQETTSAELCFVVLYLLLDHEAQRKVHAELDAAIGSDRMITWADRANLPYTQAAVNEAQRLGNIMPQNLMHKTLHKVVVNGHKIPAGTTIVPQISCVLFDEKAFPEPRRFRPERFLDDKGQLKQIDEFIPFSLGRRQCPGEGLARMELFLFTANIFNQFRLLPVDPLNPPTSVKTTSMLVRPTPFTARVQPRY